VASIGHLFSSVVFDDLHYQFRRYDQWTSCGQSKSAKVLSQSAPAARWTDDGIAASALMPGNRASTALARQMSPGNLAACGETTLRRVAGYSQRAGPTGGVTQCVTRRRELGAALEGLL
jgi:hypothetical protein